jgi:proteasome lid subunit RPN8/RPN11
MITKRIDMPGFKLRLAPPETIKPEITPKPAAYSQRWDSPYDHRGLQPVVSVFVTRTAYIRICVHSCSADVEVGGVLVGRWCMDEDTGEQFIVVKYALPARHTKQGSVYLTFTQDTLVDLHDQIDQRFQGDRIVGWFHTHPRMGIFLSHYDTFLHGNFFPEPWQVALVVEPFSSVAGFFIRQSDGILDPSRYFGFYEMDGAFGQSIVRWQNMQKAETELEGGTPHE